MENSDVKFVDFIRGGNGTKIAWIMAQLYAMGVSFRLNGMCFSGLIVQVEEGHLEKAKSFLSTPIGILNIEGTQFTDENILISDLPDDHPLFVGTVNLGSMVPSLIKPTDAEIADALAQMPPIQLVDADPTPTAVEPNLDWLDDTDPQAAVREVMGTEPLEGSLADITATDDPPHNEDAIAHLGEDLATLADEMEAEDDSLWDAEEDDDMAEDEVEETPELDYLRANTVVPNAESQFQGVSVPIRMYETESSNLSAIGFQFRPNTTDQENVTLYVRFKAGESPYRYGPVKVTTVNELLGEAVRKAEGRQDTSIGSLFHNLVKVDAEAGVIKCQRLVDGKWVAVLPKKERIKEAVKRKDAS